MTQNTDYSGSSSRDKHESHENQSSTEIRADIDQTRSAVGAKIDQLQARLDPDKLKHQAQETMQEMIEDTATTVTDYVRTHRDDMVSSVASAARRNPLPTALVGLGIGWLLLESVSGGKSREDDERREYERRYFTSRGLRTGNIDERYPDRFANRFADRHPGSTADRYGERYQGNMGREDDWRRREGPAGQEFSDEYSSGYTDEYAGYTPATYPATSSFQEGDSNGKRQGNPLAKAASNVKDTLTDTVGDVTHEIKDRMSDAGQEIKGRMEDVRDRVGDRMNDTRERASERMGGAQGRMGDVRHQAEGQMEQWQRRARYEGRRRGQQMMRNLEDNPLTYGALALAAGAALAILLPRTRMENRYLGEARDQIMDMGEEAFETAKERVEHVAAEVRPELEKSARNLMDDVKEAGKDVVQQAKEDIKPAMDKAVETSKSEARGAAQEVGAKAQSSGMALNKDTMRGQWKQIKGDIKSKWGKLTDDELTRIEGDYEKLVGTLQTRYGYEQARAEQEVNDFMKSKGKTTA